ncbi:hypothetical protein Tco_0908236 [Tanacetum coccineum]|uniref:Uncharacterized protein n=1 Tax=Tanacetum coccineum TaxID=301880 RepID=A0ABQ5CQ26_9ASTR
MRLRHWRDEDLDIYSLNSVNPSCSWVAATKSIEEAKERGKRNKKKEASNDMSGENRRIEFEDNSEVLARTEDRRKARGMKNEEKKPKTTFEETYFTMLTERNQMLSFLKVKDTKLQKHKEEREMLKERDAPRLSMKRKATINEEQPSKKPKLRSETIDELRNYLRVVDFEKNAQDKESLEGISMITALQEIQTLFVESADQCDDDFWKDQEEWEIIRWRFHESSGVHTLEIEDGTMIHMLAERRYPLSRELIQPNSPQLVHEDLQQIHPDDIEEMDLRWQMAMLTMRARSSKWSATTATGGDILLGSAELQEIKNKESSRRSVPIETSTSTALVSCDSLSGYDSSDQAKEGPNFALMAFSSSSPDLEVSNDSVCSKSCLETVKLLKSQNDQLLKDLKKYELMVLGYKTGLMSVEEKLEVYKANESIYSQDIKGLQFEIHIGEITIRELRKKLDIVN